MNNDLISREALKENGTVIGMVNGQKMKVIPLSVIDNAPTVDTYTIEDIKEVQENSLILGAKLAQRPQGEWIDHENHIECNKCQVWFLKDHLIRKSFCPNCGADMRKGNAEQ